MLSIVGMFCALGIWEEYPGLASGFTQQLHPNFYVDLDKICLQSGAIFCSIQGLLLTRGHAHQAFGTFPA